MRLKEGISPPPGHGTPDTGQPHLGVDTTTPAISKLAIKEEREKEKIIHSNTSISIFLQAKFHYCIYPCKIMVVNYESVTLQCASPAQSSTPAALPIPHDLSTSFPLYFCERIP